MSERAWGDMWAATVRRRGGFVRKLPASVTAGLPDWLAAEPSTGLRLVEAKKALLGATAFRPSQLTLAQRYFLTRFGAAGGLTTLLLLAESGFAEIIWRPELDSLSQDEYQAILQPYVL